MFFLLQKILEKYFLFLQHLLTDAVIFYDKLII